MKIVYVGRDELARKEVKASDDDYLLLFYDRWDDFGFKTRFPTECRIHGEEVELGAIRILFDGEDTSHPYLVRRQKDGWNGIFPLDGPPYVSVPEEITFYEQLQRLLPEGGAIKVAKVLRDASYLVHIDQDGAALAQMETRGFRDSLQRERSSQKSFADG